LQFLSWGGVLNREIAEFADATERSELLVSAAGLLSSSYMYPFAMRTPWYLTGPHHSRLPVCADYPCLSPLMNTHTPDSHSIAPTTM
jgi:hypothetical protein